jgi:formylglycine-generating enzyme required for sulfatase activity
MPIGLQPLDAQGKALQLMRSWLVGMPGETVSCAGCHEPQNSSPPAAGTTAAGRAPSEITPWYSPYNFSYRRDVQPVIDRHCLGCHDGRSVEGQPVPDLRGTVLTSDYKARHTFPYGGPHFSVGYFELSRYVRRPGLESDLHLLMPLEFHADTTQLVQLLAKGHHNVQLDPDSWERLITWIDLNAPYHGTWTETGRDLADQPRRRRELKTAYGNLDEDPEALAAMETPQQADPLVPEAPPQPPPQQRSLPGWPFDKDQAARQQAADGTVTRKTIHLGDGLTMEFVRIPAGEYVMGSVRGQSDERPTAQVTIGRPFWMGAAEVTNRQFACFDPEHDSRWEVKHSYHYGIRGYAVHEPNQPVVRVPWERAMAFCRWLSERSGLRCTLPTEAQWEYACRAGSETDMWFGSIGDDFSPYANLADVKLRQYATEVQPPYEPLKEPTRYDDWIPHDGRFNDHGLVSVPVRSYRPNPWGLYDMHGNVAEWTRSAYRPYPYNPRDGREDPADGGRKVVRGGSWRDRPKRCRSAFRLCYPAWQGVYNVGFRVICEDA